MSNSTRKGMEWWDRFCRLPRYSFLKDADGNIRKWENKSGDYIEQAAASALVDEMQAEINELRDRIARLKPTGIDT